MTSLLKISYIYVSFDVIAQSKLCAFRLTSSLVTYHIEMYVNHILFVLFDAISHREACVRPV